MTLRPKHVGARVRRREDPRLLTGQGCFTADRAVSNALHIAFRRSDQAHARIVGIEFAMAAALPGVLAVYTAADLDGLIKPMQATSRMRNYHPTTLYPLARDKVRYVGEPVIAVLAENRYVAEDALDLIEIAYDPLPAAVEPQAAAQRRAVVLHEDVGSNILFSREFARGDAAATPRRK